MLDAVTHELHQLSNDIEIAASKINCGCYFVQRIAELSKDLERASDMINTEIQGFSNKLQSEFLQLVQSLDTELSQIITKINLSEHGSDFDLNLSKLGLCEAVMNAGISAKSIQS